MKKIIAIIMVALMLVGVLSACSNTSRVEDSSEKTLDMKDANSIHAGDSKKISIVTTIFSEYDWVREILGERAKDVEITMLFDNGVDLHSYQPSTDDIVTISNCDMFIYVGGESDMWVDHVLEQVDNKELIVIKLLDIIGDSAKEEELIEGMEGDYEHEHEEHGEDEEHDEHKEYEEHDDLVNDEPEKSEEHDDLVNDEDEKHEEHSGLVYDEHVWLSLKNAEIICRVIADKLTSIDADNKEVYTANVNAYIEELSMLDEKYKEMVDNATKKTILFGDRFPFRYLVDDYGIDYFAAFVGCAAETEASFETIAFLANKVDELGLSYVLAIEGAEHKIAETIIANTNEKNQKVLTMDSLQSITSNDVKGDATYLLIMEQNLETLKEALK